MKKLLVLITVIVAGIAANAASFKWSASGITRTDGTGTYAGTAKLFAIIDGISTEVSSIAVSDGKITASASEFATDLLTGGKNYDFYFTIKEGDYTYTSKTLNKSAQATSTTLIAFGSAPGSWEGGSTPAPIPEPTSGLLLLLGMAGLALKRKRA